MKLKVLKRKTKELENFTKREWTNADQEHYGKVKDFTPRKYIIVALDENREILGKATLVIVAGVAEAKEVIVAQSVRGTGIGKSLLAKVEELAKKHKAHKLWLNTGKEWRSEKFYQKLGYKKTGKLPNHFARRDFVEYSKFI